MLCVCVLCVSTGSRNNVCVSALGHLGNSLQRIVFTR